MHDYGYCGHVVRSAVPLPELEAIHAARPGGRVWTCGPGRLSPTTGSRQVHRWTTDDGEPWLDIAGAGAAYRLHFDSGPAFEVNDAAIAWDECAAASAPETLRHLLLDQVLPLAMSAQGEYVLHAAAVRVHGRAILLAGASGRGKSTLAARCVARGAELLADDCVRISRAGSSFVAHASYPGLRLWPDAASRVRPGAAALPVAHYTGKLRVDAPTPVPSAEVARVYLLERRPIAAPKIEHGGAALAAELTRFVFLMDPWRREHIARGFAMTADLLDAGLVRRLVVPDALDALDAAAALIESGGGQG